MSDEEFPPVKINNLCCIIAPYSECKYCKQVACAECDVWCTGECPEAPNEPTHYLTYEPRNRIAEMQRRLCG